MAFRAALYQRDRPAEQDAVAGKNACDIIAGR
jgi:hypothetical protein